MKKKEKKPKKKKPKVYTVIDIGIYRDRKTGQLVRVKDKKG